MHFLSLPAALSLYFFLLWLLQLLQPFLVDDFCSPSSSFLLNASPACDMAPSDHMFFIHVTDGLPGNYPNNSSGNYPNKISGNYPINNLPDNYPTDCIPIHYPLIHHSFSQSEVHSKFNDWSVYMPDASQPCFLNPFSDFSVFDLVDKLQTNTGNFVSRIGISLFKWWNSSPLLELYTRVFLTLIKCSDLGFQHNICLKISLRLQRNLLRKHDYIAYMRKINGLLPIINNLSYLMSKLIMYHFAIFKLVVKYIKVFQYLAYCYLRHGMLLAYEYTNLLYERMANIRVKKIATPSSNIIGGGTSNIFTAEELQSFIIVADTAANFKFVTYSSLLEATKLLDSNPALISGYVPWMTLLPKLTVAELKVIAKCHGIIFHSKSKKDDIQMALGNHTCNDCDLYVSVLCG